MSFPTITVQCAFASVPGTTNPTWQDITPYVKDFHIKRGRNYELDQIQPGSLAMTLDDSDRRFDPTYMSSPYYPNVLPRRRIRFSVAWLGTTYYLFDGYVERWPPAYSGPDGITVSITASDLLMPLANAPISGSFPLQLSGARVLAVIAAAQWPTSAAFTGWTLGTSALGTTTRLGVQVPTTVIDAGASQIQASTFAVTDSQMALAHIQVVEATEAGVFFADGQGRPIFHDRNHRLKTISSALTFTDDETAANGTTIVAYRDIAPSFDYDQGANEVTVTRSGGVTQIALDSAAITTYFRSSQAFSTLHVADSDALNLALFRLRQRRDVRDALGNPRLRFDSVTIDPWAGDAWAAILPRDISDRVSVLRTPATHPVGPVQTISQDCFIEGVEHQGAAPNDWTTTFELSPCSPANDVWTLGNSKLGAANGTVLAY